MAYEIKNMKNLTIQELLSFVTSVDGNFTNSRDVILELADRLEKVVDRTDTNSDNYTGFSPTARHHDNKGGGTASL